MAPRYSLLPLSFKKQFIIWFNRILLKNMHVCEYCELGSLAEIFLKKLVRGLVMINLKIDIESFHFNITFQNFIFCSPMIIFVILFSAYQTRKVNFETNTIWCYQSSMELCYTPYRVQWREREFHNNLVSSHNPHHRWTAHSTKLYEQLG